MTRALVFVALDDTRGPHFKVESCIWTTFSLERKMQRIDRAFRGTKPQLTREKKKTNKETKTKKIEGR